MKEIRIRGTVFSGKGEGAKFVSLPWVKKQIQEKLGYSPYIGTLNIRLTESEGSRLRRTLTSAKATEIAPAAGFRPGKCFKASLMGKEECAVVIPETARYPKDVVELIAPANLRKQLQLKDDDTVEVKIKLE